MSYFRKSLMGAFLTVLLVGLFWLWPHGIVLADQNMPIDDQLGVLNSQTQALLTSVNEQYTNENVHPKVAVLTFAATSSQNWDQMALKRLNQDDASQQTVGIYVVLVNNQYYSGIVAQHKLVTHGLLNAKVVAFPSSIRHQIIHVRQNQWPTTDPTVVNQNLNNEINLVANRLTTNYVHANHYFIDGHLTKIVQSLWWVLLFFVWMGFVYMLPQAYWIFLLMYWVSFGPIVALIKMWLAIRVGYQRSKQLNSLANNYDFDDDPIFAKHIYYGNYTKATVIDEVGMPMNFRQRLLKRLLRSKTVQTDLSKQAKP